MNICGLVLFATMVCFPAAVACNTSEPTTAVLSNEYPNASEASSAASTTIYKGWWSVAQFADPVLPRQVSDPVRIVPGSDYGYALLALGWDATSGAPPTQLVPVRTVRQLSVARGELLNFLVSPSSIVGDCRNGDPLSQEDAEFITQRIFPGAFTGLAYDAASCSSSPGSTQDAAAGGDAGE